MTNKEIEAFNIAIALLPVLHSGKHVQVVDMSSIQANQLVEDGIHPNDGAYKFMAGQWLDGIKKAVAQGWVKNPIGPDPKPVKGSDHDCHKKRSTLAIFEPRALEPRMLEPRGTKSGHVCAGGVVWSSTGRIAHGVSTSFSTVSLLRSHVSLYAKVGTNGDHKFNQKWTNRGYAFGSEKDGVGKDKDGHGIRFADLRGTGTFSSHLTNSICRVQ